MRLRDIKTRCKKRALPKCSSVFASYDEIQNIAGDIIASRADIVEIRCNVWLEGLGEPLEYSSDFVCKKTDGEIMVRECVFRKNLTRPKTAHLLGASHLYWTKRGVKDWGIIVDATEDNQ